MESYQNHSLPTDSTDEAVFWVQASHIARNQLRSGTRELCRMVPAVGEVWRRQALQNIVPRPVVQPFVAEQFGQTNPVGQRTPIKYSQQACWLANRSVNSTRCFGKSSLNCPDLRRQRRESKDSLVHH